MLRTRFRVYPRPTTGSMFTSYGCSSIRLRNIPNIIPLKIVGCFPKALMNFTWRFLELNRFICNYRLVLPVCWHHKSLRNNVGMGVCNKLRGIYNESIDGHEESKPFFYCEIYRPPNLVQLRWAVTHLSLFIQGHFTHETECPWPLHFKHSLWWKKAFLRDQRSMWMQDDGCKVYMDSYMASNGSCFMVVWIVFTNHFLEIGLTQNRETMTLWTFTNVDLFYFIMCEDSQGYKFNELVFGGGPDYMGLHTTLEGLWPHDTILEVCWDSLWTLSFGLSQSHGHGSWLMCEVPLNLSSLV
jgi:hypothetical protein